MNAIESLFSTKPTATAADTITSARNGPKPLETGVFDSFADTYSLTLRLTGTVQCASDEQMLPLPGGNILPLESGAQLPGIAEEVFDAEQDDPSLQVLTTASPMPQTPLETRSAAPDVGGSAAPAEAPLRPQPAADAQLSQRERIAAQTHSVLRENTQEIETPPANKGNPARIEPATSSVQLQFTVPLRANLQANAATSQMAHVVSPVLQAAPGGAPSMLSAEQATRANPLQIDLPPASASHVEILRNFEKSRGLNAPMPVAAAAGEGSVENLSSRGSQAHASGVSQLSQAAAPAPLPQIAETPRPLIVANSTDVTSPATPAPQRHDFGLVVERLAEARELARPGRAEMQVMHREFGQVSMQFDVNGGALKVALANAHAGFAPAVHTALAERPANIPTETVRAEMTHAQTNQQGSQSSSPQHSTAASGGPLAGHSQGDGQQRHAEAQRANTVQSQPRENEADRESDTAARKNPKRDNALFA